MIIQYQKHVSPISNCSGLDVTVTSHADTRLVIFLTYVSDMSWESKPWHLQQTLQQDPALMFGKPVICSQD